MVVQFWIEADARQILVDEQVVAELPDLAAFTDAELGRIVCKGAKRIHGDWWHCFVGTNGGTDDWSEVHEKVQVLADQGVIITDRADLPTTKNIDLNVIASLDEDNDPVYEIQQFSIQDLAALHSFGVE